MKDRIKSIRKDKNLTQLGFAEKLGITRSYVSAIEVGASSPSTRTLNDICDKFNVRKSWLEFGDGEKYEKKETNELAYLIGRFAAENDDFKKRVITSMLKLDDNGWSVIQSLVEDITTKKD